MYRWDGWGRALRSVLVSGALLGGLAGCGTARSTSECADCDAGLIPEDGAVAADATSDLDASVPENDARSEEDAGSAPDGGEPKFDGGIDAGPRCVQSPWTVESVGEGHNASMTIAPDGVVHMAYASGSDRAQGELMHASRGASGQWRQHPVDIPPNGSVGLRIGVCGYRTSIVVSRDHSVHIGYCMNLGEMRFASRTAASSWRREQVDRARSVYSPKLFFRNGQLESLSPAPVQLGHGIFGGGSPWNLDVVDTSVTAIITPDVSIAVDASGTLHVAYLGRVSDMCDERGGGGPGEWTHEVRYVTQDASGTWSTERIEASRTVRCDVWSMASGAFIAVDGEERVHIVYADQSTSGLGDQPRHAVKGPEGGWMVSDLEVFGPVAFDSDDVLYVTDGSRLGTLVPGGTWTYEVIPSDVLTPTSYSVGLLRSASLEVTDGRVHVGVSAPTIPAGERGVRYATRSTCPPVP